MARYPQRPLSFCVYRATVQRHSGFASVSIMPLPCTFSLFQGYSPLNGSIVLVYSVLLLQVSFILCFKGSGVGN